MNIRDAIADIFDVRPGEGRTLALATLGAFLVMSFVIASRALRDAFFLDEFGIQAIPWITGAVALLGIPVVVAFTRGISGAHSAAVYRRALLVLAGGIVALQAVAWREAGPLVLAATVGFYLWTALGSLLVTSGFWTLAAERFELRDAKRLFALIAAGGTLGAMITGLAMRPLVSAIGNAGLVMMLWGMLLALWLQQLAAARAGPRARRPAKLAGSLPRLGDGFAEILANAHLRGIAAIVVVSTFASYLIDYQFKNAASATWQTDEQLAAFFGSFYGLTGVLALLLQVLVAGPLLARGGVGWSLAILPIALGAGTVAALVLPGLAAVTGLRGADNTLRRSLQRSVLEFLYVPVPVAVRRRTKAVIDSLVDNVAEGIAAMALLFALAAGASTRSLTVAVLLLAVLLLWLSWRMSRRYLETLRERLRLQFEEPDEGFATTGIIGGEAALSLQQFDLRQALQHSGVLEDADWPGASPSHGPPVPAGPVTIADQLAAADPAVVRLALQDEASAAPEHLPALIRLLARDALSRRAADRLVSAGSQALAPAAAVMLDEGADFVIRRRMPAVLAQLSDPEAGEALVRGLAAGRFEVRYRCGVALAQRRADGLRLPDDTRQRVWSAIRRELAHERPVWELQQLLDARPGDDPFVTDRVADRGSLSLEHTFRLLSLVLEEAPIRTAFQGVLGDDAPLRDLSLEYLDQVLPADVRLRLWPFIGDLSAHRQRRHIRGIEEVVGDLLRTGVTLFGDAEDRARLQRALQGAGTRSSPPLPEDTEP